MKRSFSFTEVMQTLPIHIIDDMEFDISEDAKPNPDYDYKAALAKIREKLDDVAWNVKHHYWFDIWTGKEKLHETEEELKWGCFRGLVAAWHEGSWSL